MSENTGTEETQNTGDGATNGGDGGPERLPDDHPLVTTLAALKEQNKELRAAKRELDQIKEAQMSEQEKVEARVKAAEDRAAELEVRNRVAEVALEYGLSADDAALLNGVSDVETMRQIAERLADQAKRGGHHVVTEGTSGGGSGRDERREFADFLVGRSA